MKEAASSATNQPSAAKQQLHFFAGFPCPAAKKGIVLCFALACRGAFGSLGWAPFRSFSAAGNANKNQRNSIFISFGLLFGLLRFIHSISLSFFNLISSFDLLICSFILQETNQNQREINGASSSSLWAGCLRLAAALNPPKERLIWPPSLSPRSMLRFILQLCIRLGRPTPSIKSILSFLSHSQRERKDELIDWLAGGVQNT